jgi:hypothetical protein
MGENEFQNIVNAVCKNPKVYTKHGNFEEVITFLEGYAMGANVGNNSFHSKFTPFLQWVAVKFDMSNSRVNWDEFRKLFENESESFRNLASLYNEYADSNNLLIEITEVKPN